MKLMNCKGPEAQQMGAECETYENEKYGEFLRQRYGQSIVFTNMWDSSSLGNGFPCMVEAGCYSIRIRKPLTSYQYVISARHNMDPERAFGRGFKEICRVLMPPNLIIPPKNPIHRIFIIRRLMSADWYENVEFICTAKMNHEASDDSARLYIMKRYTCSSFCLDYWYALDPNGLVDEFRISPFY